MKIISYNNFNNENWIKMAGVGSQWLNKLGFPKNISEEITNFLNDIEIFESQKASAFVKNVLSKIEDKNNFKIDSLNELSKQYQKKGEDVELNIRLNSISHSPDQKKWLKQLHENGKINPNKEDDTKISLLLQEYKNLENKIPLNNFKNDSELFDYIKKSKREISQVNDTNIPGAKLIDKDKNVDLYLLTSQEAIDEFGKESNWCVVTSNGGKKYTPNEYYCFVINGIPSVLAHPQSEQLKDIGDKPINDVKLIEYIGKLVEKHNLHNPESYSDDYEAYSNSKALILDLKENLDDDEYIRNSIIKNENIFNVLPNEQAIKHVKTFFETYDITIYDYYLPNDLSLSKWEILIEFLKQNNEKDMLSEIKRIFFMDFVRWDFPNEPNIGTLRKNKPRNLDIDLDKVINGRIEYWINRINKYLENLSRSNPFSISGLRLPEDLKNNSQINKYVENERLKFYIEGLKNNSLEITDSSFPQDLKNNPEILKEVEEVEKTKNNEKLNSISAKNKNRNIWASYFNDNYIGKF